MRLVIEKIGSGWRWVVEKSELEGASEDTGSLDCAGSFVPNDPASLEMTKVREDPASLGIMAKGANDAAGLERTGTAERGPHSITIPYMEAVADPREKWWERMRGNPKKSGEISQAAFLLKASMMGFNLALPWGDSERWDFVVWGRDGKRVMRVQVKGTGRLYLGGYEVQPVHSTRRGGKKRYTKKDIDVIAAHVQPVDAWYLIPIEAVGRAKSLRLYPERKQESVGERDCVKRRTGRRAGHPDWERWLEHWELLGKAR